MRLVVATHNRAKAGEMLIILRALLPGWELLTLNDFPEAGEPEETGETYAENATIKAEAAAIITGERCIADDAGLEVDALAGAPGVKSKRFMGVSSFEFKMVQILTAIEDEPDAPRTARFRCCVAIAKTGEPTQVFESRKEGLITEPRGHNGFGYDPIFLVPELGKTYAELESDHKNHISHRRLVLEQAAAYLKTLGN